MSSSPLARALSGRGAFCESACARAGGLPDIDFDLIKVSSDWESVYDIYNMLFVKCSKINFYFPNF